MDIDSDFETVGSGSGFVSVVAGNTSDTDSGSDCETAGSGSDFEDNKVVSGLDSGSGASVETVGPTSDFNIVCSATDKLDSGSDFEVLGSDMEGGSLGCN